MVITAFNDEYGDHSLAPWIYREYGASGWWVPKLRDIAKKTVIIVLKLFHGAVIVTAIFLILQNMSHAALTATVHISTDLVNCA